MSEPEKPSQEGAAGGPAAPASPPFSAARKTDHTEHGGAICDGSDDVTINRLPAARLTDYHHCPLVINGRKHEGGPISKASTSVTVNGLPAARVGDALACDGKEIEKEKEEGGVKLGREGEQANGEKWDKKTKLVIGEKPIIDWSAMHKEGQVEGKLGSLKGKVDVDKVSAKVEAGAYYNEEEQKGLLGVSAGGGFAGLAAQGEYETPQLPIPWTDWGVSLAGEGELTALSAKAEVGAGIAYDKEGGFRLYAAEKAAAFVGEGVKLNLVVKHRKHVEHEPEQDKIKSGSPNVFIGG